MEGSSKNEDDDGPETDGCLSAGKLSAHNSTSEDIIVDDDDVKDDNHHYVKIEEYPKNDDVEMEGSSKIEDCYHPEMEDSPDDEDDKGPDIDPKLESTSRPFVKMSMLDRQMAEVAQRYITEGRKRRMSRMNSESSLRKKDEPPNKRRKQVMNGEAERGAVGAETKTHKSSLIKKTPKEDSNGADQVEAKPSMSTPLFSKEDQSLAHYNYFCIDCEDCPGKSYSTSAECCHSSHPRRVLKDMDEVAAHIQSADHKGHSKFQPVHEFVNVKMRVSVCDLAYSKKYGNRVRKKFKRAALGKVISKASFRIPIKCKICGVTTANNLDVFRHIREEHLSKN